MKPSDISNDERYGDGEQLEFILSPPEPNLPQLWTPDDIYNNCSEEIILILRLLPFVPALLDVDVSDAGAGDGFMVNAGL
jgi:hypothetical protein